jgi:hypothetical protein
VLNLIRQMHLITSMHIDLITSEQMAISHPRSSAGCVEMEGGENSVHRLKPRVGGRSKDPPLRCDPDQNRTFAPARFRRNRQNASQRNKLDPYGFAGIEAITGRLLSR